MVNIQRAAGKARVLYRRGDIDIVTKQLDGFDGGIEGLEKPHILWAQLHLDDPRNLQGVVGVIAAQKLTREGNNLQFDSAV